MPNYRIQITLKEADLNDVRILVDVLAEDFDLSIDEFDVETYEQKDDESWESIGILFDPDA
jgi:hypothetical protein